MTIENESKTQERLITKSYIVLERVPENLRHKIWYASDEELGSVILETSRQLKISGLQPLTQDEVDDAFEGNWLMNLSRE